MQIRTLSTMGLLLTAGLAGCGGATDAPHLSLEPVSGKVTYAGQPVSGLRVLFVPLNKTAGQGAFAVTEDDGSFELEQQSQDPGVPAGQYAVLFSRYVKADGTPVPPGTSPTESNAVEAISPIWNDPGQAGPHNTVTVPEGGKSFEFSIP
jgi:hypothetical protein